ncbi:hypothetical protein CAPTEDRAFT_203884 [Capitella teleta]|uniref:Uncharacterized protein n=1 Tax=Capitella teleta TaxID=283909 RepID=R7UWS0_CAPTE|nr:hypothetical protein CAPTEDRAFT_203884 [Capitella teleta]|eukprot:ELU07856.1 hypothetical protein CAPTEDRAFT_203884 [Capitella teleta]
MGNETSKINHKDYKTRIGAEALCNRRLPSNGRTNDRLIDGGQVCRPGVPAQLMHNLECDVIDDSLDGDSRQRMVLTLRGSTSEFVFSKSFGYHNEKVLSHKIPFVRYNFDITSKNGNLLLSLDQNGGHDIRSWMRIQMAKETKFNIDNQAI